MGKKLFVGGLAWAVDDDDLRAAFEAHGEVLEARVITDRDTGRSRGFGFVTMADDDAARAAVQRMDGFDLKGRRMKVNEAEERRGGGPGPGGPGGPRPPRSDRGPRPPRPEYGARGPDRSSQGGYGSSQGGYGSSQGGYGGGDRPPRSGYGGAEDRGPRPPRGEDSGPRRELRRPPRDDRGDDRGEGGWRGERGSGPPPQERWEGPPEPQGNWGGPPAPPFSPAPDDDWGQDRERRDPSRKKKSKKKDQHERRRRGFDDDDYGGEW